MESFVEECMKTYSSTLKKDIDDKFDKLQWFTKQTIKSDIMTKINDSSNYNYSKIPVFDAEKIKSLLKKCEYFGYNLYNGYRDYNAVSKFFDDILLMKTEKICTCNFYIVRREEYDYSNQKYDNVIKDITAINTCIPKDDMVIKYGSNGKSYIPYYVIILTNYGRLLISDTKNDFLSGLTIKEYNTWLPLNYIELINLTKPFNIIEVMNKITNELYMATYTTNDDTLHKVQVENNELTETNKIQKSKLQQLEEELKSVSTQHTILQQKINSMKQILL